MTDIKMPQMGESIAEGTISVWLIGVGQRVEKDQPIVTVSTDKADVDIPSPVAGTLAEITAPEGKTVAVGELIARVDEAAGAAVAAKPAEGVSEAEMRKEPEQLKEGVPGAEAMKEPLPEKKAPPEIERPKEAAAGTAAPAQTYFYSPAVMRLAVEHGIDLRLITGTGHDGRVTKADVMRAIEGRGKAEAATAAPGAEKAAAVKPPGPPAYVVQEEMLEGGEGWPGAFLPSPPAGEGRPEGQGGGEPGFGTYRPPVYEKEEGDTEVEFTRLRRLIADHMVYSKRTSAHVTTFTEVDLDHVVGIREANKDSFKAKMGISLTFLPFVMLAAVRAIKEYPLMNSVVQGDRILTKRHINLGVAVDTERGLLVPVIRSTENLDLPALAKAVHEVSGRVRERKVAPDELAGGTFTVSNPGKKGNLFGTPIISQPQVGILRMGEVVKRAVVVEADGEDAIAIRPMMYLSLSYDHRVVDGLTANEFLHRVKELLEEGAFTL